MRSASVPTLSGVPPPATAPLAGFAAFAGDRPVCRQHGLDRRIRPFELHREFGDFGGDIVDAFAQQRILHALGRPRALGLLLDRVDIALQLAALVARDTKLFFDRGLLGPQFSTAGDLPPFMPAISSRNSFAMRSAAALDWRS